MVALISEIPFSMWHFFRLTILVGKGKMAKLLLIMISYSTDQELI
jgi:hypothetical protein